MICILLFCAGAIAAFLGWLMDVLSSEFELVGGGTWSIILYIVAVLVIVVGLIDGVVDIVRFIRNRRGRLTARITHGLYTPPKNSGKKSPIVIPPKRPTKTGAKGKK